MFPVTRTTHTLHVGYQICRWLFFFFFYTITRKIKYKMTFQFEHAEKISYVFSDKSNIWACLWLIWGKIPKTIVSYLWYFWCAFLSVLLIKVTHCCFLIDKNKIKSTSHIAVFGHTTVNILVFNFGLYIIWLWTLFFSRIFTSWILIMMQSWNFVFSYCGSFV